MILYNYFKQRDSSLHIPSEIDRDEILATPEMVRISMTSENGERYPIFIIRTNTLQSKYVLQQSRFKLTLLPLSNSWMAYGLEIEDDAENPMLLWSIVEREKEIEALKLLALSSRCSMAIFNEIGVNVAFVNALCEFGDEPIKELSKHIAIHPNSDKLGPQEAISAFNKIRTTKRTTLTPWVEGVISPQQEWKLILSTYVTSQLSAPTQSLADLDEGGQQEQLVEWMTDGVEPESIHRSPQVKISDAKTRELIDVIATSKHTYFLFESKSLTILGQNFLPERKKLAKNIAKHVKKATKQLRGAIRHVVAKKEIFDLDGAPIKIPDSHGHAIIMTPDISLTNEYDDPGANLLTEFVEETDHLLHILDPSELLRLIQGALRLVENGSFSAPADAFNVLLVRRFENAVENDTVAIEIVHRFAGDEDRMGGG